jgi:hypothetical protein
MEEIHRNPAPVEKDDKVMDLVIYSFSTIQRGAGILPSYV